MLTKRYIAPLFALTIAFAATPVSGFAASAPATASIGKELSLKMDREPALPAKNAAILRWKTRLASEYHGARTSGNWTTFTRDLDRFNATYGYNLHGSAVTSSAPATRSAASPAVAQSKYQNRQLVNVVQQPQTTNYYCGPAAASESLSQWPNIADKSQDTMAYWLNTSTAGTAWSGPDQPNLPAGYKTSRPMPDAINYKISQVYYGPVAVAFYPTSTDYSDYLYNLTFDIDYSYPLQGNAYEVHNGPRLVGHPNPAVNDPIFHWYAIYGYTNWGDNTRYADSVYNAPTVSWYQGVTQPYSVLTSHNITDINGGRGYVW